MSIRTVANWLFTGACRTWCQASPVHTQPLYHSVPRAICLVFAHVGFGGGAEQKEALVDPSQGQPASL